MVSSPTTMALSSSSAGCFLGLFWWLWRAEENSVLLRLLPSHRVIGNCWFLSLGSFVFPHLCVGGIYLGTVTGNPYVKFLPLPFCRFPGRSLLAQFAWGKQPCEGQQQIHSWGLWQRRLVEVLIKSISGLGKVADGVIKYSYSL